MAHVVVLLLLALVFATPIPAEAESFNGTVYSLPAGWVSGEQEGVLLLAPADATEESMVVVVLSAAQPLGAQPFRQWLQEKIKGLLSPEAKVVAEGEVREGSIGALQTLTTARAVQDAGGGVRMQVFHAVSQGGQAALAMAVAASEAAFEKHVSTLQGLFESLTLASAPAAAAVPGAVPQGGAGERVPRADLVGGRPQGLFVGVSMLSGNPVFLLFLDQGRVYHNMPRGGMNRVDWAALLADNSDICGRWSMSGSVLRIEWNDGNVWEGPLEVTPTGIQFYGKSYGKALPVSPQEMVGSWEGVRSTAWLNLGSGPATTQVNSLRVDAAGNYLFGAAMGADVAGATSYSESSQRGRLTIDGYDAIFQAADGSEMRMSIVGLADGGGVILDGTYFVRQ